MTRDVAYIYNASGLVTEVLQKGSTLVKFFYNDRNHRVRKETYVGGDLKQTTFYVRNVAGQVMALYSDGGGEMALAEQPVYGNGRIGVAYNGMNDVKTYVYELTDHLGNVRAVFTKSGADDHQVEGYTDYYPFGMPMPNRTLSGAEGYRYAFQGQEKDPETGKEAFQLRLWDSRIGRWLTTDPYGEFSSPYLGMGNNPISITDPDGGCTSCIEQLGDVLNSGSFRSFSNVASAFNSFGGGQSFDSFLSSNIFLDEITLYNSLDSRTAMVKSFTLQAFNFKHNEKNGLSKQDMEYNQGKWPEDQIQPYLLNPWMIDISELPDAESQGYGVSQMKFTFNLNIENKNIPVIIQYSPTDSPYNFLSGVYDGRYEDYTLYNHWREDNILIGNDDKKSIFVVGFKTHQDLHHIRKYLKFEE